MTIAITVDKYYLLYAICFNVEHRKIKSNQKFININETMKQHKKLMYDKIIISPFRAWGNKQYPTTRKLNINHINRYMNYFFKKSIFEGIKTFEKKLELLVDIVKNMEKYGKLHIETWDYDDYISGIIYQFKPSSIETFTTIIDYYNFGTNLPDFVDIYNETIKNMNYINKQWNKHWETIVKKMDELCNMSIKYPKITINIVHDQLPEGHETSTKIYNDCFWSGQRRHEFKNYDIIYLTHEIFHAIFPGGFIYHCIHELVIDNELRIFMNGKKTYKKLDKHTKKINPFVGGMAHRQFMNLILPDWLEFKNTNKKTKKTIFDFFEEQRNKYKNVNYLNHREEIKKYTDLSPPIGWWKKN